MTAQQLMQSTWKWAWDVERAPDGTVLVRRGAPYRFWRGLIQFGFAFLIVCLFAPFMVQWAERASQTPLHPRYGWHNVGPDIAILSTAPLLLLGLSLWTFLRREEWLARPGLLELQQDTFGFRRTWRYTNGTFVVRRTVEKAGSYWRLYLQTPEASKHLACSPAQGGNSWADTTFGQFVQVLASATRFSIQDPDGQIHPWRADPVPGPSAGGKIEIRHLHTGQVLGQVAGSTLAGADLAGSRLEGANLQGADLRGADLSGSDLRGASLKDAKLADAKLRGTLLTAAGLTGADLTGVDLKRREVDGRHLRCRYPLARSLRPPPAQGGHGGVTRARISESIAGNLSSPATIPLLAPPLLLVLVLEDPSSTNNRTDAGSCRTGDPARRAERGSARAGRRRSLRTPAAQRRR